MSKTRFPTKEQLSQMSKAEEKAMRGWTQALKDWREKYFECSRWRDRALKAERERDSLRNKLQGGSRQIEVMKEALKLFKNEKKFAKRILPDDPIFHFPADQALKRIEEMERE